MQNESLGVLSAIGSAVFMALGVTFSKMSYKEFSPSITFFFHTIFGVFFWIPISLFAGFNPISVIHSMPFAFISAILSEGFFYYAISHSNLAISNSIVSTYSAYTAIFSVFFLGESLTNLQIVMILFMISGTFLILLPKNFQREELKRIAGVLWAVAGAIGIGLADTFAKNSMMDSGASNYIVAVALAQIPVSLFLLSMGKQEVGQIFKSLVDIKYTKFSFFGGLLCSFSTLLLFVSFGLVNASIASPISGAYPLIIIIFSSSFLKEKFRKIELIGIISSLVGIFGISLTI